jgi:hypothetical protein
MQALTLIIFCVATLMDFATESNAIPGVLKFSPELLSILVAAIVLLRALRGKLAHIPHKYWFAFGFLSVIIICGIFTNDVGTGPVLAGMRYYLRAIPMFFLFAVAEFSEKNLRTQLKLLVVLALVQVPVSIYQRWTIIAADRFSGDDVRGTLMDSGVLSLFLICVVLILTALHMRGHVKRIPFLILFFTLLIPTTINETKATVIFLPLGLMTAIIAASPRGKRIKVFLGGLTLLGVFAAILLPIYAMMNANSPYKDRKGLLDFFTNEQQVSNYINDKKDVGFGTKRLVGRGTAIRFPLQYLARDPVNLAFGLGIGNASHSSLGNNFTGKYYDLFQNFVVSAAAAFLLELGLVGTGLVFVLYWLTFTDTLAVARQDQGLMSALAAGFIGVIAVMSVAEFYDVTHAYVSLSYPYWYLAGAIASRRGELLHPRHSPADNLSRAAA